MTATPAPKIEVAIVLGDAGWLRSLPRVRAVARRAVQATAKVARLRAGAALGLALTSDRAVRALNHDFRGQDKPTNVLSFPTFTRPYLGDIALARATIAREARQQGKSLEHHLAHLVVHGVLHLLGHDHAVRADARRMEALEKRVLAGLGIGDPYVLAPAPPRSVATAARARQR